MDDDTELQTEANTNQPQDDAGERQQSQDNEKRARDMGWVPEHEWRGDPPKNGFKSADEYIKHGEDVLPVVRSQNKRLQTELAETKSQLAQMRSEHSDTIKRLERMSTVALQQQRSQIESQYAARKEAAVDVGDKESYRQIVKEEKEAIKTMDDRLAEPEKKDGEKNAIPPAKQAAVEDWIADNPWFKANREMESWAIGYHGRLLAEKPGMTLAENLEQVSARARKLFPEAFDLDDGERTEPEVRRGSRVESGSRVGNGSGRSLASKLPAEARSHATKFIRDDGLFLEKGETPEKDFNKALERYATQYFEGESK